MSRNSHGDLFLVVDADDFTVLSKYVGVLISLCLFLFPTFLFS
jgi:hypothetical protein